MRAPSTQLLARGLAVVTVVLTAIVVAFAVTERTPVRAEDRYNAVFHDVGGLAVGSDVTLDDARIGTVSALSRSGGNTVVTFIVDAHQRIGSRAAARIRAESRTQITALALRSAGNGPLWPGDTIPLERTASYAASDAKLDALEDARCPAVRTLDQLDQSGSGGCAHRFSSLLETLDDLGGFLSESSLRVGSLIIGPDLIVGYLTELCTAIRATRADTTELARAFGGPETRNERTFGSALERLNDADARLNGFIEVVNASLSDLALRDR